MGVTFASSCVLSLTPSSTCIVISVMSVVAWRHFPASRSPQQSDWHLCANLTKERPATKERPWGSVSLALYSSYRRMMEWQHFSCPLQLYLSCRLPSHAYLSTSNCQRYQEEENEWIKNEKNHQKIQKFLLIVHVKQCWLCTVSAAYRNCEWVFRRQKLASTFPPVLVLLDENTEDYFTSLWSSSCVLWVRKTKNEEDWGQVKSCTTTALQPVMPIYCTSALPGTKLLMSF